MMERTYTYKKRNLGWVMAVLGAPLLLHCHPQPALSNNPMEGSAQADRQRIAQLEQQLAERGASCTPTAGDGKANAGDLQKRLEATTTELQEVQAAKAAAEGRLALLKPTGSGRLCLPPEGPLPPPKKRTPPHKPEGDTQLVPPPEEEKTPPPEEPKEEPPAEDIVGLKRQLVGLKTRCKELPGREKAIPVEKQSIDVIITTLQASNGTMTCQKSAESNLCAMVPVPTSGSNGNAAQKNLPGATSRAIEALKKRKASLDRNLAKLKEDCTTVLGQLEKRVQAAESNSTSSTPQ